jgi:hypothetical protein
MTAHTCAHRHDRVVAQQADLHVVVGHLAALVRAIRRFSALCVVLAGGSGPEWSHWLPAREALGA